MGCDRKPNVIVFFTDQQRFDTSGLYGNTMDLTPNFDRMAMEGTHCYNAFTCQPVCLPARASLQTGKYASQLGILNNNAELPQGSKTLGHFFKEAGYQTGYIGKWHLCFEKKDQRVPKENRDGYDYWLGANVLEFCSDSYRTSLYDNDGCEKCLPGYRADALTDAAIRFIDEKRDNPFFLFVSYIEPHFQNARDDFPAPFGYEERYQNPWTPPDLQALGGTSARHLPGYYGMVKRLDETFGRMRDAVKSLGLEENTIILYTTDHGCHFKTRNSEYKRSCHDSSIRIPMAITGPGFKQGGRLQELISLVDVPPTLLDACGIEVPESMEGRSILPLLNRSSDEWPEAVFSEIYDAPWLRRCVRTKRWKYSVKAEAPIDEINGIPYIFKEEELYDLKADPWELNNLIGFKSHSQVSSVMKRRLLKYLNKVHKGEYIIHNAPEIEPGQKTLEDGDCYL